MRKVLLALGLLVGSVSYADEATMLNEARSIAEMMPTRLNQVLVEEIDTKGQVGAISVCRDKAPMMARAMSDKTGWAIRRVSLRNRNPKATPDPWESAVLQEFDRRVAAGASPIGLEMAATVVTESGFQVVRYMKALPTREGCMQCHGNPDFMSPAVLQTLKELYPDDKALGYNVGEVRGAISMQKPLQ